MNFLLKLFRTITLRCTNCGRGLLEYSDKVRYCENCPTKEELRNLYQYGEK